MPNFKNVLYLIVFIVDLCQSSISFDRRKHFDTLATPVVMITNKVHDSLLDESMVQYGSIIHLRYVLTFENILKMYQPEDVLVHINCYSEWFIFSRSCSDIKQVSRFKFITDNYSSSTEIEPKYGLIILENRIFTNPRVEVVRLAVSDDIVDKSNCMIYSFIHHEYLNSFVSYVTPIRFQERDGSYSPITSRKLRLIDDNDQELEVQMIASEVSFYGSPIVCALNNSNRYVQVGISNLKIEFGATRYLNPSKVDPQISKSSFNFSPEETKRIQSFLPLRLPIEYSIVRMLS